MARWLMALICVAGCDQTWGLVHVTPRDAAIDTPSPACPGGYDISLPGWPNVYRYEETGTTWDAAELLCAGDAPGLGLTHLVVLSDDEERTALVGALLDKQITASVWIGLSDRIMEGQWRWVTAEMVGMPPLENPPWPAGQPDNGGTGNQDCVRIQGMTGAAPTLFDDGECSSTFDFVCECDGIPPEPANF